MKTVIAKLLYTKREVQNEIKAFSTSEMDKIKLERKNVDSGMLEILKEQ